MTCGQQAGQPVEGSRQVVTVAGLRLARMQGHSGARESMGSGQGSVRRPAGPQARPRGRRGRRETAAWVPSPIVLKRTPPCLAAISRQDADITVNRGAIAARSRSQSAVLPSMSVKRKVTVPEGRSGIIRLGSSLGCRCSGLSHVAVRDIGRSHGDACLGTDHANGARTWRSGCV